MRSRAGPDAGAAEVVGSLLMLSVAVVAFVVLAQAALEQARETAAYIRGLVPEDEAGLEAPERCVSLDGGRWCRRLPAEPRPGEVCVLDERGWQWCLEVRSTPLPRL